MSTLQSLFPTSKKNNNKTHEYNGQNFLSFIVVNESILKGDSELFTALQK